MEDDAAVTAYLRSRAAYYRRQAEEAADPDQAAYCRAMAETFDQEAAALEEPSRIPTRRTEGAD